MNGEERLECDAYIDGVRLEHVSDFKYLEWVLDEAGTDGTECSRKVTIGGVVAGAIRSLVILGICRLSVLVLHETLLVPVLTYGSEKVLWKERERSKIRAVQMDNIRGLLG